jgi:chromosome partitioning protein
MAACPVLTFFNNKGGVGKTTLVSHVSAMAALLGKKIVILDLDPQSNLTGALLTEDRLTQIWAASEQSGANNTIEACLRPLLATSALLEPKLVEIRPNLYLLPGSMSLAGFEDELSETWIKCLGEKNLERPFTIQTAFWQLAQKSAKQIGADLVIVDVGPNLGAINRAALVASDFVVIPIGADLFSLQGLSNLGPALREWRSQWAKRLSNWTAPTFELPAGRMQPVGYLLQQYSVRLKSPVKAYDRWVLQVPSRYRQTVLNDSGDGSNIKCSEDPLCLAMLKHYQSLIPLSQESRKPLFLLKSADGAIGAHQKSVATAYQDFLELTQILLKQAELEIF